MPARENLPKILERRGWVRLVPRFPMSRLSISTRGNVLAIRSKHDASGDTHAVSAHVETIDSAHQLELDFRAPVLQMVLPNQETLKFWRATADYPQEVADRIAKVSRSMQQYASASTRVAKSKSKP